MSRNDAWSHDPSDHHTLAARAGEDPGGTPLRALGARRKTLKRWEERPQRTAWLVFFALLALLLTLCVARGLLGAAPHSASVASRLALE